MSENEEDLHIMSGGSVASVQADKSNDRSDVLDTDFNISSHVLSQDFTRLPGFLVLVLLVLQASSQCNYFTGLAGFTPVGAALPTSLDVLLVMILMQ